MNVGVRELRNGLSRYLDRVHDGAEITVTDHGKPVARIVGYEESSELESRLRSTTLAALIEHARKRGISPDRLLADLIAIEGERSGIGAAAPRGVRNGIPLLPTAGQHVITDELVALHRDDG
ncbi:type II toxin-antitoxin system Phd/YefM family antitoxin [Microbacterium sp.]|uniref:type II toxin-antitoxin system Phd/YefM family antitoxin n=1 Tax=Microbacterium sp. TaxID=51671 RepID=UPI0039E4CEA2